jgi:transposase
LISYPFRHAKNIGKNSIEGFWSYAKERLLKFHGVSRENFVCYLKELEFRYDYRDNIEDNLYVCLCEIK